MPIGAEEGGSGLGTAEAGEEGGTTLEEEEGEEGEEEEEEEEEEEDETEEEEELLEGEGGLGEGMGEEGGKMID